MNTQTMDLNKMGLAPMSQFEITEIDGGGFWDTMAKEALAHLDDIVNGIKAGWNSVSYK